MLQCAVARKALRVRRRMPHTFRLVGACDKKVTRAVPDGRLDSLFPLPGRMESGFRQKNTHAFYRIARARRAEGRVRNRKNHQGWFERFENKTASRMRLCLPHDCVGLAEITYGGDRHRGGQQNYICGYVRPGIHQVQ